MAEKESLAVLFVWVLGFFFFSFFGFTSMTAAGPLLIPEGLPCIALRLSFASRPS